MDNGSGDASDKSHRNRNRLLKTARVEVIDARRFLRKHRWRLLLVFAGVLLPLWAFGELAESLHKGGIFPFDVPALLGIHAIANAGLDRVALFLSAIGYAWGVIPGEILLVLALVVRRHFSEALFAGSSFAGSLLLVAVAKHTFARVRPDLWQPIVHESSYSFPSGHAMASMTLAWVVVLLCWYPRSHLGRSWRWPVTIVAALFVLLVGLSRLYLGVHYPSDILAGWTAASAWVVGMYGLVFRGTLQPWQAAKPSV